MSELSGPSEAFQVICAQPQADLLPPVDVDPKDAHRADPHLALRGHLTQQPHRPVMLAHDASNARVGCQPM